MKRNFIIIGCVISTLTGLAQQTEKPDSFVMLSPLEVRSIRVSDKGPFTKTNLTQLEIKKLNQGQDIPFILNHTPSVVINSDAGNGIGYTGIRIRGTDITRINVTINGIPLNDAESQGAYFIDMPDFASSIGSLQIQRGIGTSTNGAGAFGATISLSTAQNIKNAYAEINTSVGSFNSLKNTVKVGTGLIDNHFAVEARLSRISSDGYLDRATSRLYSFFVSPVYYGKNFSIRSNIFSGKEKTYQAWNGLPASHLKTNRTFNSAGTEKPDEPYKNETDNYWQTHYHLIYNQSLKNSWELSLSNFLTRGYGYYENYKANRSFSKYGLKNFTVGDTTISKTDMIVQKWLDNYYYGQVFSLQQKTSKQELAFGGGWTQYDGKHYGKIIWAKHAINHDHTFYDLKAIKKDANLYAKWQYNFKGGVYFFADLQYRFVNYTMNGFADNPTLIVKSKHHFYNPKVGISYIKNGWNTFFSIAKTSKEPNRNDFEAAANNLPKAETLYDFEIGIEKKSDIFSGSITGYYMYYSNQLVQTGQINDVGAYTRINVPKSFRAGVEIQGGCKINNNLNAQANLTLSSNKIKKFTQYYDAYDAVWNPINQVNHTEKNTTIAFSPAIISSVILNYTPVKSLEFSAMAKYVGKQNLDNTSDANAVLQDFYTQDIRVTYTYKKLKNSQVFFQLNNIFNKKYEPNGYSYNYYLDGTFVNENYYYPMAGLNFMAGINISL